MDRKIATSLLERYFDGKDRNQPEIIEKIFSDTSVVTFDINTDVISFPSKLVGAKKIAASMFDEFHHRFDQIESYYLIDKCPPCDEQEILGLKWIVTMRERDSRLFRIGTGYYDWRFMNLSKLGHNKFFEDWRVQSLHIYIHDMLIFKKTHEEWLKALQSRLSFPWLKSKDLLDVLRTDSLFHNICDYVDERTPADTAAI